MSPFLHVRVFAIVILAIAGLGLWNDRVAAAESGSGADTNLVTHTTLERLERARLEATHRDRERLAKERGPVLGHGAFEDFRAVVHVHAEDAEHTKGTRAQLLEGAKKAGIQVVLSSDHRGPKPDSWRGLHDGVLYIAGSETGDGTLWFPEYGEDGKPIPASGLKFLSHIEERYDAKTEGMAGMEVVNRHTEAILDKGLHLYLASASADAAKWKQVVEDFKDFPDEMFGAGVDYRKDIEAKWDRETASKVFTGVGANDSHRNQIFGDVVFDPYDVSFRHLVTHILARDHTEKSIREALVAGRTYVAHDWLCDPSGFTFAAVNNLGVFGPGDRAPMVGNTRLMAATPVAARLRLFRNGALLQENSGTNMSYEAKEAGAYRLEAWLKVDGELRPWIYASPVYTRSPGLGDAMLPSSNIDPEVEVTKDLVYTDGPEESASKHKLDVYRPKNGEGKPVFVFIHGGAWRYGDRNQYPALGNRYAKAGYLTILPSYRLAPKYPFPAQIEDVSAAFAWVVKHAGEYGGDTNRIYVGGHSAGGHLAALLALDARQLARHGLSSKQIRGVLALSGVYDLSVGDSQSSVFGKEPQARLEASPLHFVAGAGGVPPFLVTFCQRDYFSLPAQARALHAALLKAGVTSELVYIPELNHISEMLNVNDPKDPTVEAALRFMK